MDRQVPGIVAWLPASPCEAVSVARTGGGLRVLWLARVEEGLLFPGWGGGTLVAGGRAKAALWQLDLGGWERGDVLDVKKLKENLPGLSGSRRGEGPPPRVGAELPAAHTTSRLWEDCQAA